MRLNDLLHQFATLPELLKQSNRKHIHYYIASRWLHGEYWASSIGKMTMPCNADRDFKKRVEWAHQVPPVIEWQIKNKKTKKGSKSIQSQTHSIFLRRPMAKSASSLKAESDKSKSVSWQAVQRSVIVTVTDLSPSVALLEQRKFHLVITHRWRRLCAHKRGYRSDWCHCSPWCVIRK